jgi:chemotaxis regulatin CheY-phosphate phosphatase CheZ
MQAIVAKEAAPMSLSPAEFLEVEEEIASSQRGRAFLRQYAERQSVVAAEQVRRLLRELMIVRGEARDTEAEAHVQILRRELQEMSGYIQRTREEIAALHPDTEPQSSRIILATGELDAIVSATERATSDILAAAERIQETAERLPKLAEGEASAASDIAAQAMEIMMACSFQDITGQRTTKVVNTLRYIEQRVNSMIAIWDVETAARKRPVEPLDRRPDAHLLNGPPLEGGVSQDDVDALLAPAAAAMDQSAVDDLFA